MPELNSPCGAGTPAWLRRRFQIWTSHFLLVLALLEMHDGNLVSLRKAVDRFHILLANLAKSR